MLQQPSRTRTISDLEAEAVAFVRAHPEAGLTIEQRFVSLLEAEPALYTAFKAQHDAAPVLAKLRRAGVALRQ